MDALLEKLKNYGTDVSGINDQLFTEGNELCRIYARKGIIDEDDEDLCHQQFEIFKCEIPNCVQEFDSLLKYELHYNSCHRYSCSLCKKQLPSPHLLDIHVSEMHDSFFKAAAERKPMYKCFVETCCVNSQSSEDRRSHCIEVHKFPHDFRYDTRKTIKQKKEKLEKKKAKESSMETDAMEQQTVTTGKPSSLNTTAKVSQISGPFTFGHKRGGKVFYTKRNKNNSNTMNMADLMESLPSDNI